MTKRTFEYSEIDTPNNRKARAEMKVKQYMHRANDVKGLVDRLRSVEDLKWHSICNEAATAIEQLAEENSSMRAVTERQLAKKQCELDQLKKTCNEYAEWLGEKEVDMERLEKENEALKTRCKEADLRAKPYGMGEWKAGEKARASYVERITALEKENTDQKEALEEIEMIATEQDRKIREDELRHQAEIEKLRGALGMFLFHPTAFDEAVENARRVLAVKDEWKPVAQTADEYLAKNPEVEKKFWEDALQVQLDSVGESQWTKNIREGAENRTVPTETDIMGNLASFGIVTDTSEVLDRPRQQDVIPAPWAKWLVRGPTNRVFYDVPTLRKAEQLASEELQDHPGGIVEIYKLQETAENEISPVRFTKAENNNG